MTNKNSSELQPVSRPEWLKRNITDEPRLSELVELYESLGFEVKTENFIPENFPKECSECMLQFPEKYKVIYTRKKDLGY